MDKESCQLLADKTNNPQQDDDVDTDDDILSTAICQCKSDLSHAFRLVTRPNGRLNFPMLQNATITDRINNPFNYDRNGKIIPPKFDGDKARESLANFVAMHADKGYQKYSCQTVIEHRRATPHQRKSVTITINSDGESEYEEDDYSDDDDEAHYNKTH